MNIYVYTHTHTHTHIRARTPLFTGLINVAALLSTVMSYDFEIFRISVNIFLTAFINIISDVRIC